MHPDRNGKWEEVMAKKKKYPFSVETFLSFLNQSSLPSVPLLTQSGIGEQFDFGAYATHWKIEGAQTGGRFAVVHHPLTPRTLAAPLHRHHREDEYSYVLYFHFCVDTIPYVWRRPTASIIPQDQPISSGKAVTRNQNTGVAQRSKPLTVGRSSLQGQLEERLRIAERIVQALREAGRSCELADEAYSRNGVDLPSRH
jgi:hypothetical protein